jgi:drug/metabolite transporter (DMT)-like permease
MAGYAFVALAASAWGTWPLFLREAEAAGPLHPAIESAFAMTVMTLASAPFCLWDRVRARPRPSQWLGVVWLGFSDAMNVFLFFRAYQTTTVAIAVMTHYLAPLFVAMAAPLVLRERLTRRTLGAVGLSFVGLALLLSPRAVAPTHTEGIGAALGAASAAFYASNVIVNKRITPVFSGSELVFYHGVVAAPVLLLLVPRGGASGLSGHTVLVLLAGSFVAGAMGGLMFVWGLRRIEATRASGLTFLEPLVAVISAWAFLHEGLTLGKALGGVLILTGAALVVTGGPGQRITVDSTRAAD